MRKKVLHKKVVLFSDQTKPDKKNLQNEKENFPAKSPKKYFLLYSFYVGCVLITPIHTLPYIYVKKHTKSNKLSIISPQKNKVKIIFYVLCP